MKLWSFPVYSIVLGLVLFSITGCLDPQVKGIQGAAAVAVHPSATPTSTATPTATPTPTPPHTLSFSSYSTSGTADTALGIQPTVQVKDLSGVVIPSDSFTITLTAYSDACLTPVASGVLATTNPLGTTNGVAAFSGVTLTKISITHLGASDGMVSVCSNAISIAHGAADHLLKIAGDGITAKISCTIKSCGFTPLVVQVVDQYENVYTSGRSLILTNLLGLDAFGASYHTVTSDAFGFASFETRLGATGVQDLWVVQAPTATALPDLAGSGKSKVYFTENLLTTGNGSFAAKVNYRTDSQPVGIAVGDFNEDGNLDVVTANGGSDSVTLSLASSAGDGTFNAGISLINTGGTGPFGIAVGDFNRDGHLDIAVTNHTSGSVGILLGAGDGTFTTGGPYTTDNNPNQIVVGDLNGDGILDLVTANDTTNSISVLLGVGDGTFGSHTHYTTSGRPIGLAMADLNNDGILDVVTRSSTFALVSVLVGNGDGTFGTHHDFAVATGAGNGAYVTIADFNGDGILDLATQSGIGATASLSVLLGTGAGGRGFGKFPAFVKYSTPGISPGAITAGDVNGDSRVDLILADGTGNIQVFSGNGDGTFNAASATASGISPYGIAVGDFNHDGKLDIVSTNYMGGANFSILLGN